MKKINLDDDFDDDFDKEIETEYKIQQSANFLIHGAKEIAVLLNIFHSGDLDVFESESVNDSKPKQIIDSKSILKHDVLKDLIAERLEFLRDEAGMLLEKFL